MIARLRLLFIVSVAILSMHNNSWAKEFVFAHIGAPGSLHDTSAREFARRVNAQLGDKIRVEVFGNSALGGDTANLEKLKAAKIEMTLVGTAMSSVDERFGVFELPFLLRDREHMARVRETIFNDTLAPAAKAKGYRLLAAWELGFRHITNTVRPISTPEDLKGVRIRVPPVKWLKKAFESYGATVTTTPFNQIVTEIQNGTVDGQETVLELAYAARIHEVQKYLSLTYHLYTPAFLVVNDEQFAALPPDVQEAISRIAVDMEGWSRQVGAQHDKESLEKLQRTLKTNNGDMIEFYQASAKGIYKEFAKSVPQGAELVQRIERLAGSSVAGN